MQKVLCIGEALIDMICTDRDSLLSNGEHFIKKPGGAPTNVAAAIAAMGGKVELAAKVGTDPFGQCLVKVMEEFGVSTKWMLKDPEAFTTFAFVSLMENGERDFYFNRGADSRLKPEEVDAIDLDEFSIVHFGSATAFLPGSLQQAYLQLLKKCLEKNILISFDPNYRHLLFQNNTATFIEQSWNFLKYCHFFKLSDEEALLLTGMDTLKAAVDQLLEKTRSVFAITLGKEGAILGFRGGSVIVPGIIVKPIDTTGAGDAFVGSVLYQLNQFPFKQVQELTRDQWIEIFSNANKAGAHTCEHMGAMEAFRYLR